MTYPVRLQDQLLDLDRAVRIAFKHHFVLRPAGCRQ